MEKESGFNYSFLNSEEYLNRFTVIKQNDLIKHKTEAEFWVGETDPGMWSKRVTGGLTDVKLSWKDSRFGGAFTAFLFIAGKSIIEISIGNSQAADFYGVAGSILVLMLWVFYTTAIFIFGAYVTHTLSKKM